MIELPPEIVERMKREEAAYRKASKGWSEETKRIVRHYACNNEAEERLLLYGARGELWRVRLGIRRWRRTLANVFRILVHPARLPRRDLTT